MLAEKQSVRGRAPRFSKTASPLVRIITIRLEDDNGPKGLTSTNFMLIPQPGKRLMLKRYSSPAPTAVRSHSPPKIGHLFTGPLSDVGGGSVDNGERNSLARIPLRWMIRECFKVNTGIIFDAHMLKHEVGLDTDSIYKAPKLLSPTTYSPGSDGTKRKGSFSRRIPGAIDSTSGPSSRIWGEPSNLPPCRSSQVTFSFEQPRFISRGEAQEELDDALSPIYDQLEKHIYWKVMEWIPCTLLPSRSSPTSATMDSCGAYSNHWETRHRDG
jgi:hypothetical protein